MFRRKWTRERLRKIVSSLLPYAHIMPEASDAEAVAVYLDGFVACALAPKGKEIMLTFNADCQPNEAAELATVLRKKLPVVINLDQIFTTDEGEYLPQLMMH